MTKYILINAFTFCNLGDDLFIRIVLDRYPNEYFEIITDIDYSSILKNYKNIKFISSPTFSLLDRVLNKLFFKYSRKIMELRYSSLWANFFSKKKNHLKAYILLGGSIFQQSDINSIPINLIANQASCDGLAGIPKFILGANFGPFFETDYLVKYKKIFSNFDDICFRDLRSKSLFSEFKNVRNAPDLVFQLSFPVKLTIPNTVGFSVMDFSGISGNLNNAYISLICDLINSYIHKNYKIYLFSFCKFLGDEKCAYHIIDSLPYINHQRIEFVSYTGNINDFLKIYSSVEIIFATRFHSMILGFLFNKKVFPIVYHEKMINFLDELHFSGNYLTINNINQFNCKEILTFMEQSDKHKFNLTELSLKANEHFKILDQVLSYV